MTGLMALVVHLFVSARTSSPSPSLPRLPPRLSPTVLSARRARAKLHLTDPTPRRSQYAHRVWVVSEKSKTGTAIAGVISILTLVQFAFGAAVTGKIIAYDREFLRFADWLWGGARAPPLFFLLLLSPSSSSLPPPPPPPSLLPLPPLPVADSLTLLQRASGSDSLLPSTW